MKNKPIQLSKKEKEELKQIEKELNLPPIASKIRCSTPVKEFLRLEKEAGNDIVKRNKPYNRIFQEDTNIAMKSLKTKQERIFEKIKELQTFLESDLYTKFRPFEPEGMRIDYFKIEEEFEEYLNDHFNILRQQVKEILR